MKHYNVKDRLIDGAIKVIARDGLDKATTKAITNETKLYETYIYQHFKNKDGLLAAAFEKLDEELQLRSEYYNENILQMDPSLFDLIEEEIEKELYNTENE